MMALSAGKLIGTGVVSLGAGGAGLVPLTVGSLQLMGAMAYCAPGDLGDNPGPDTPADGCQKMADGGYGYLQYNDGSGWKDVSRNANGYGLVTEIVGKNVVESLGRWYATVAYKYVGSDSPFSWSIANYETEQEANAVSLRILPEEGECASDVLPSTKPLPPEAIQPITYVDDETNCTYNVQLQGFAESFPGGPQSPVWLIEGSGDPESKSSGSRYGGCNFAPVLYYDDSGGGPGGPTIPPIPIPPGAPGGGGDWWKPILQTAVGGFIGNTLAGLFRELIKPKAQPAEFEFVAPCDKDEEGNPLSVFYEWPEQTFEERCLDHQAAILEILQQHLNWKTPICFSKYEKGSYARSITFQSEENTDRGNRRCTKRFGYRSNNPCELESLYEHWRDFSWNTGPVIVGHSGSALGSPQVWASSESEGKRVIRHAAGEAGVDPDQDGEWTIGSSDSPRYGLSHTVKLMEVRGLWQATARQGPDGYAQAVWSMPDP
jgi:hypothetical protein